jgi:uncharacterized protein YabE (DUF348 family)/3D (Asp-Asp-Asp) domain-containing protein
MNYKLRRFLLLALPMLGIVAGYLLMARPVTLTIDGQSETVTSRALTVRGVLRSAGILIAEGDSVSPDAGTWLTKSTEIQFSHAGLIRVWIDPQGEIVSVNTDGRTPAEIVIAAGILPKEGDLYRVNGQVVDPDQELNPKPGFMLQYTPRVKLTVALDGGTREIYSAAPTLGEALWKEDIRLLGGDYVNPTLDTLLTSDLEVTVKRGLPLVITVDGKELQVRSTAETVGQALQQAGVSLQDLDYSKPNESAALPEDGKIEVIRVTEEILTEQYSIPYSVEYIADPDLEPSQRVVRVEGENGLQVGKVRVRYENGIEVSRTGEGLVVLKQPVTRQEAYSTTFALNTINTPEGPLQYYHAVTVTATAYSPCRLGIPDYCNNVTASGTTVHRGIIAVHLDWYRILKGTKMYVPGYGVGVIADTGAYPYNHNWVDLGYTDEEFELYAKFIPSITVYLLAPAPPGFTGELP